MGVNQLNPPPYRKSASQYLLYSMFADCIWRTALLDGLKVSIADARDASGLVFDEVEDTENVVRLKRIALAWRCLYSECRQRLTGSSRWLQQINASENCIAIIEAHRNQTVEGTILLWKELWLANHTVSFLAANHALIHSNRGLIRPPCERIPEVIQYLESSEPESMDWLIDNCILWAPPEPDGTVIIS